MTLGVTTLVLGVAMFATEAAAGPINPSYSFFGDLSGATFGGSGIPTDPTAVRTIVDGANTITMGLTAFGRYQNPALSNNGAGTFVATPGSNTGDPNNPAAPPHPLGTTWGFGYYVAIAGGGTFADYDFDLLYDLNPGVDTDETQFGRIDLNNFVVPATTVLEDAQSLLFAFFAGVPVIPGVTPPPGYPPATFDPNAQGEYTLALRASKLVPGVGYQTLGLSAIDVRVVPEPTALALLGLSLVGLVKTSRRRIR